MKNQSPDSSDANKTTSAKPKKGNSRPSNSQPSNSRPSNSQPTNSRPSNSRPHTRPPSVEVLYEDNHLLVVNKPAGLATMGAEDGRPTLHAWACRDIGQRFHKPGKVFIGVVHRLDQPTSGVVVLARTSKAASRLSAQFAAKSDDNAVIDKRYLAILHGCVDGEVRWSDHVFKDDQARRMRVAGPHELETQNGPQSQAKIAVTDVFPLSVTAEHSLVKIRLQTGRKHQIRVQSASHSHAVVGDFKYDDQPPGTRLMLHASSLTFQHPTKKESMTFVAPAPEDFRSKAESLGLDWDLALRSSEKSL